MRAVRQHEQTRFLAFQEFFDDDASAIVRPKLTDRITRFSKRLRDHHAFALRETVRLDHERMRLPRDINKRCLPIGEAREIGRRNTVRSTKLFDEALRTFELCPFSAGAHRFDPTRFQAIPQSRNERRFGADDDECDGLRLCKGNNFVEIGSPNGDAFGDLRDAAIPRRTIKLGDKRAGRQRPGERMLPSARADEKNLHGPFRFFRIIRPPISSPTMSEPARRANLPEYSVSEIAAALKRTVEGAFPFVRVRGEISGLKFHSSGHVYFDLKDEKAVLNAVVWRATALVLKQKPEQGLEVICTGRISTYAGSSRYQLVVEQIELAGFGALMALIEERKKKLAAEGLFAESRETKLPFLPDVIGVVTSPTGAVIRDIMHRLDARFPRRVLVWPVAVQGDRAGA